MLRRTPRSDVLLVHERGPCAGRRPCWSRVLAAVVCLGFSACSGGDGDTALDGASFISSGGVLLDADLDPVRELTLPDEASVSSVSIDGEVLFSSSIGATESQDCCGPNMDSLFVVDADDDEWEPLFAGEIGISDREPDWAPSGEQVVFVRWTAPVYADDGSLRGRDDVVEGLYVFTLDGDTPRLLATGRFTAVEWSPDGQLIAATEHQVEPDGTAPYVLRVFDAESGAPLTSVDVNGFRLGWAPSSDRVVVTVAAGHSGLAVGLYDIGERRMAVVPGTDTLGTGVWVWGPDGPIIELNRSQGSLLARVDPDTMVVTGLRRCPDSGMCDRPVEALRG